MEQFYTVDKYYITEMFYNVLGLAVNIIDKKHVFVFRAIASGFSFTAELLRRLVLRKEELIIVSKVTRELEFRGYLL